MNPTPETRQKDPQSTNPQSTALQLISEFPCHIVTGADGTVQIKVTTKDDVVTADYPFNPNSLLEAFSPLLTYDQVFATRLVGMVLTALMPYRSIAKSLKILANPDNCASNESTDKNLLTKTAFIEQITNLEARVNHSIKSNLQILESVGGTDLLESIVDLDETRSFLIRKSFLDILKEKVDEIEVPEKRGAAYRHFALRLEAVVTHLFEYKNHHTLVASKILNLAHQVVDKYQDPIAGANFLQANLFTISQMRPYERHNNTELLLTAQKKGQTNSDYIAVLAFATPEELPFMARLPLTRDNLLTFGCLDYAQLAKSALNNVCKTLDLTHKDIWKVFSTFQTQAERSSFFQQIIESPRSFTIYQLNHPHNPIIAKDFIHKHLKHKNYFIDPTNEKVDLYQDPHGNTSLIDLVSILASKVSPNFLKADALPEKSFFLVLETLSKDPNFLKIFNALCNQSQKTEIVFGDLFTSVRAGDNHRTSELLLLIESTNSLSAFKKALSASNQ